MKKIILFALLLCALSSCESREERWRREAREMVEKENAQWEQHQRDIYHQSDSLMRVIGSGR